MSIHKLTAGSGYDYLTRQVAAMDATAKGHVGLASYYTEKGETPGVWLGSGMAGIDGLGVGDPVTADQMTSLFGVGHHPLATERVKALERLTEDPDAVTPTEADYKAALRLGAPYKVYRGDVTAFQREVAQRLEAINVADDNPRDFPLAAEVRSRIRTEVAREFFRAEHGRDPDGSRELAGTIAKHSLPKTTAVAGFDLTFSPVKSVSVLWALAEPEVAAKIEQAHVAAINEAIGFLERTAVFTRRGANGAQQVDVTGLVATAFTHRDSRAGDPDLHTHVAVANKVQALDGTWLSLDGRVLFKATVAASETYNTALERHLIDGLGVAFEPRAGGDARQQPVREIVGVDARLNERFSKRRTGIEARRSELAARFQRDHGRPPTPVETLQLAQQATLETRSAKHEPRTLAEQREAWHSEAIDQMGAPGLRGMLRAALGRAPAKRAVHFSRAWVESTAEQVVEALETRRSTWQFWHVYAHAQRQVREAGFDDRLADRAVDELVDEVLRSQSVSLERPDGHIVEPEPLRRRDGESVFVVAGSQLHTSVRVLEAEQRLVASAGRAGGHTATETDVSLALLETEANGVRLNPGQTALVRDMATSGRLLQLAIAPAGSGKTTAMHALSHAWTSSGGNVIGLAPSAAAADALHTQIEESTDTLAKLVFTLTHPKGTASAPDWMTSIGPKTLVIIDEAGMADTMSLDVAVGYLLSRGASVRLIGDDQQLSAIGAGGVLRDIRATHGALHLSELVRFINPAEGAASLALREGRPEALGFYLDHDRVHVGDLATMTDEVFASWQADRGAGRDPIMLAPTRDLVRDLNQRAREYRLTGATHVGREQRLADGNLASAGDLILTRENSRRLRTSRSDWVKNGDRWTIMRVERGGGLKVRHCETGRTVVLPADYVAESTDLGYACTIHGAQGVTAGTMHGLLTGDESRQLLYTMATRGKVANHLYVSVVGDGDPHTVVHPDLTHPRTPTDLLEAIMARDEAAQSATTQAAQSGDPRVRLGEATDRYVAALYAAAERTVGADAITSLERRAEVLFPGLTVAPAWVGLRSHLLLIAASGEDPVHRLESVATREELASADDMAAVLDWRLDTSGLRGRHGGGPLPWVPGIPDALAADGTWGDYLKARADLVTSHARQVRVESRAADAEAAWAQNGLRSDADAVADVAVWRAANRVDPNDRRPTGPRRLQKAAARHQAHLDKRLASASPAVEEWRDTLCALAPALVGDDFTALLAERLAAVSRAGIDAVTLLRTAAGGGPLPDDHAAAALWWRMSKHLTPAVAAQVETADLAASWQADLATVLGEGVAREVQASNWWPALAANVDHALARGWSLSGLLAGPATPSLDEPDMDVCQMLVWRSSIALSPLPVDETLSGEPLEPVEADDYMEIYDAPDGGRWTLPGEALHQEAEEFGPADEVATGLAAAGMVRRLNGIVDPHPTDADVRQMIERAQAWETSGTDRASLVRINGLAQQFFEQTLPGSWGQAYLRDRFGVDLVGHEHFRPGQAPDGWTGLVEHLRGHGVSDDDMVAAGVAMVASTGRLIDRFRNRVMFPIVHNGDVLGFVGRRHPDLTDADRGGPKYLNTADTVLFHKGGQLYGVVDDLIAAGGTPVRVEGPMDAIAVTLATAGRFVGVAPLGTSLTSEQASQLARIGADPIVATDADLAGQVAAERDFWMLAPHGMDPLVAQFPDGMDPADVFSRDGAAAVAAALVTARPLGDQLVSERLDHLPPGDASDAALAVLAAQSPAAWPAGVSRLVDRLQVAQDQAERDLLRTVRAWDADPRSVAAARLAAIGDVRARLEAAGAAGRWDQLARTIDERLLEQPDWPATARMMQDAHDQGHDVAAVVRSVVAEAPLGPAPARDLRYRLFAHVDLVTSPETIEQAREVPESERSVATRPDNGRSVRR